ncbi:hypothetical protein D9758_017972 [Tetrapyrgos nigripes]|uniref:Uncharacterized protein n=1 Tax=Tetrapyrgos nigripes TaxID=182062 RepID=A0A8H5C5Q9_9AGAR|nr:hypothetical protein D9758_017972 [Tetrapyrgos nigripes]
MHTNSPTFSDTHPMHLCQEIQTESFAAITAGVISAVIITTLLVRLRYPCLTVFGLDKYVDSRLKTTVEEARKEGLDVVMFEDTLHQLHNDLSRIKVQNNSNLFRWSSLHTYLSSSFSILQSTIHCYDEAEKLHVSVLNAMEHKRQSQHDFELQYRRRGSEHPPSTLSIVIHASGHDSI